MRPFSQNVHVCREYEKLAVPLRDLMDAEGKLEVYPEVNAKGYFDIDYAEGKLVLKSKGFVGLIPISDRVTIHVLPRAPIGNLLYMVWKSGGKLTGIDGFVRGYQEEFGDILNPESVYFDTFLKTFRQFRYTGPLRRYRENEVDRDLRGRLLISKTVSRFRSHGMGHRQAFSVFDLSVDIPENRILKHTAERLLQHFVREAAPQARDAIKELSGLLTPFGLVDSSMVRPEDVARLTPRLVRGLPASHRFYEAALWLSYLIATRSGVRMEKTGRARFETVIIDVASVFEVYVRQLCLDVAATDLGGCRVFDGNRIHVPLFCDTNKYPTKPDIYLKKDGKNVALADVKYKPKLSSEDRYELLGFCEALEVDVAAFICPKFESGPDTIIHGTTVRGRKIHVVTIDLAAVDMRAEERRFTAQLGKTLGVA